MRNLMGLAHGRGGAGIVTTPNLIQNGSFVSHADGWYPTLSFALTVPSFDAGALLMTAGPAATGAQLVYRPGGVPVVALDGLTTLDAVGTVVSAQPGATASFNLVFYADALGTTTVGSPQSWSGFADGAGFALRDVAVPGGAAYVRIGLVGSSLGTGGACRWDDLYVGPVDGDSPPYPAVAVPLGNRIFNGTFETGIADWSNDGAAVLSHETVAPLSGTGSLKVTCPGGGSAQGAYSSAGPGHVVIPGETIRYRATLVGAVGIGALRIYHYLDPGGTEVEIWTGTPSTNAASPTLIDETAVIPAGKVLDYPSIDTVGTQTISFRVDDVSIVAVP